MLLHHEGNGKIIKRVRKMRVKFREVVVILNKVVRVSLICKEAFELDRKLAMQYIVEEHSRQRIFTAQALN